jgi:hypothetical protein
MATATHLSRSKRLTSATFSVSGAPSMPADTWTTIITGRQRQAIPFEVDLTWLDGSLSGKYTIRAWRMKADGTPGKVVITTVLIGSSPDWLVDLIRAATEPGTVR